MNVTIEITKYKIPCTECDQEISEKEKFLSIYVEVNFPYNEEAQICILCLRKMAKEIKKGKR